MTSPCIWRLFAELRDGKVAACPRRRLLQPCRGRWPKPISPPPINGVPGQVTFAPRGGDLSPPCSKPSPPGLSPRSAPDRAARLLIAYGWARRGDRQLGPARRADQSCMAFYMSCNAFFSQRQGVAALAIGMVRWTGHRRREPVLTENGFLGKTGKLLSAMVMVSHDQIPRTLLQSMTGSTKQTIPLAECGSLVRLWTATWPAPCENWEFEGRRARPASCRSPCSDRGHCYSMPAQEAVAMSRVDRTKPRSPGR